MTAYEYALGLNLFTSTNPWSKTNMMGLCRPHGQTSAMSSPLSLMKALMTAPTPMNVRLSLIRIVVLSYTQ